jgi:uncharacterized Fe-S cluster-containing radical SAM superfamily protein
MDQPAQIKNIAATSPRCEHYAGCGSSPMSEGYSLFFREWVADGCSPMQLPISAVCNSRCVFCSNDLNPFPIARGFFRDIEDIKLQLAVMDDRYGQALRLSESIPGRIAEGEAFLHPQFFDILRLIRRKFPMNLLCFTTNGSMLDEAFVRELSRFRPIEITLSMHSARPDLWARIFGKSESSAVKAIDAPRLIKEYRMALFGAMVPLPRICGWPDIENTYKSLASSGARGMILYWPGYSRCSPPEAVRAMECSLGEFADFADRMRKQQGIPVSAYPSMRGALPVNVAAIVSATMKGNPRNLHGPYRNVLWLASEAAHERLRGEIDKESRTAGIIHTVHAVPNETYRGNIIAAGLLMVDDFVRAGKQALRACPDTDLVLVPKTPFDNHLRDLQGEAAYRIAEALRRPVWVVSDKGRIHHLLEKAYERKDDSAVVALKKLMERFNQVWEDDIHMDSSLDLVHAFPVKTPWGLLTREELMCAILSVKEGCSDGGRPISQTIQLLDRHHALCTEKWSGGEAPREVLRWTFLLKKEGVWGVDYMSQSVTGDAP